MAAEKAASKRKFFVGGNWKCNNTVKFVTGLCDGLPNRYLGSYVPSIHASFIIQNA